MASYDKKRHLNIEALSVELCKAIGKNPDMQKMLPPVVRSNLHIMSKALRTPEAFIRSVLVDTRFNTKSRLSANISNRESETCAI